MMTVKEVSKLTGVSIRTLQYYDEIGLLPPSQRTEAGYRLYDDTVLERLQQILLFRELEFSLTDIKAIVGDPDFDRAKALDQQIELLTLKRERLEGIIRLAREQRTKLMKKGETQMDFTVFDTAKIDEYTKRAKAQWGSSKEYREFEEKNSKRSAEENEMNAAEFMRLFAEFGGMKDSVPDTPEVREQVVKLRDFITEHYYECSDEMLSNLGRMYSADGEFKANIDKAGGEGTAEFVSRAIEVYCGR